MTTERKVIEMPGFDGTGPLGLGPMTGRGRGYCMMRLDPAGPMVRRGYAGIGGWAFVSVVGWGGFPTLPLFAPWYKPMARNFLPFAGLPERWRPPAMPQKSSERKP